MIARYRGHRDKNHAEIAKTFESLGWSVMETSGQAGACDLVISKSGTYVIEIKRRTEKISIKQLQFFARWQGRAAIICDIEEAARFDGDKCLTSNQKAALLKFCITERLNGAGDKKEYSVNRILNLLKEVEQVKL